RIRAVACAETADLDLVAGLQDAAREAASRERVHAEELDRPLRAVAVGVRRFHVHPRMRIRPFDLRDGAGDLDRLADVELRRERMMGLCTGPCEDDRERGARGHQRSDKSHPSDSLTRILGPTDADSILSL